MNLNILKHLVARGEGRTLEFKRSTGELREALQTVCAFLNGDGGTVVFGVRPDGTLIGQEVSDQTLREMTQALDGFEPPVRIETDRVQLPSGRDVLIFRVEGMSDTVPFIFGGRAYERIESTTRRMPQRRYEQLLLNRAHSRRRWENQGAEGTTLQDIDRAEVFRVVDSARAAGRLVEPVGRDLGRVLDRLSVRRGGRILRAAVVLFGTRFLPDFPQCELRLARFRGIDKTEFLDQQQLRATAFKLLEEVLLFCQRHLPLPGRIESGRLERVDRPLIPPDALREIVVNALIHRDYTIAGGAVSLAIFDDRVEIWSAGRLPLGLTPQVTPQVIALLKAARQPHSREELQRILGLKDRRHFQKTYIEALLAAGWLEMTVPNKPRSRLQRYRTTAAGLGMLQTHSGERP